MRAIKTQKGFTIVETMIALSTTSLIFISTVALVNDQFSRTQFRESSYNAEQQMAGILNDVRVGYFSTISPPAACGGTVPGSSNCIYAGKKIEIDSTDQTIKQTSLYKVNSNVSPIGRQATELIPISSTQTINSLPHGIEFTNDQELYLLFENYIDTATTTSKGLSQSVGVYGVDISNGKITKNNSGFLVCASNRNRYVSFIIGEGASPTVRTEYSKVAGC
jgi:type II secretory pathway pseudopilin PulG